MSPCGYICPPMSPDCSYWGSVAYVVATFVTGAAMLYCAVSVFVIIYWRKELFPEEYAKKR